MNANQAPIKPDCSIGAFIGGVIRWEDPQLTLAAPP
jgi:hypothetical protein